MIVLALQLLGFALNVWAKSQSEVDMDVEMEVERNVTGVLGEEVVLRCQYTGQEEIIVSSWDLKEGLKSMRLVGWINGPLAKNTDFSLPASASNLTVTMRVSSLEAEREYWCNFITMVNSLESDVFLTVLVRPDVQTNVEETVENGTQYQTASCSAIASKPAAEISWSIDSDRNADGSFSVSETTVLHLNGTSTLTSVLRFPTHLQDRAEVTCVISHPALPKPILESVRVQTFVAPNVTIETRGASGGADLLEILCVAAGGRPAPDITWLLPGYAPEGSPEGSSVVRERWDERTNTVTVFSSVSLQAHLHEGKDVTCTVTHPKLLQQLQATVTLPTYELSAVRVFRQESAEMHPGSEAEGQVVLTEGQRNVSIQVEVTGNVPRYRVTCGRENGSLPAGMEVIGSVFRLEGPIEPLHAGLYTCQASYYSHRLSVALEIVVTPAVVLPAAAPPSIKLQTREDVDHRILECSASDGFPAPNVSWRLPEALSGTIQSSAASRNGSHSVTSVLRLPVCSSQEHTVECVIEHPALAAPHTRQTTLRVCASPNITLSSSSVWDQGAEYTEVECSVEGGEHRATISWSVDCDDCAGGLAESMMGNQTGRDGSGTARSLLRLPTHLVAGRVVACVVDHPALRAPDRREIWVPSLPEKGSPRSQTASPVPWSPVASVGPLKASALWLAVCEVSGAAANVTVSWVLPENSTGRTTFRSGHEEGGLWAKSTYVFSLARHEGQNLTCLTQDENSTKETTLHIPQFYISSLGVLDKTTSAHQDLEEGPVTYRVTLHAHTPGQRVLLKVHGNVPHYRITCTRSDGSAVRMEGREMVFPQEVSEREVGLYTCRAFFYHHSSTVLILVEVTSDELQFWMLAVICVSAAAAVMLILAVSLCVFCKRTDSDGSRSKAAHGKRESLAALTSLMQDPSSPAISVQKHPKYAELVRYSIVIDVKTNV
ncbi:uncharacterized protein si:ch211-149e23.4 [Conger conger]|uniref:uncharacterized protein si:ch211-149e23.4 n=1 Tax=Conger conger TaxID=82655 RepID=UPI002A5A0494|nr:uncharacterized protein si:ch211-149e23.4 [Conger conger]